MAHKITWLIEKRLILLMYEGIIDKLEMQMVNAELEAFLLAGEKPVHLISDDRLATKLNIGLRELVKTFSVLRLTGWGYILTIGNDTRQRFFFKTLKAILNMQMLLYPDQEIALAAVLKLDTSLKVERV